MTDDVASHYLPYQSAVQARQRSTMDFESATLALHAEALRPQHSTLSATRIIKKRKQALFPLDSEAGPSTTALLPASIQPEPQELDVIGKLRRGEGLFSWELLGLIEQCGICKRYFTGGVLLRHIFVCPSSEV